MNGKKRLLYMFMMVVMLITTLGEPCAYAHATAESGSISGDRVISGDGVVSSDSTVSGEDVSGDAENENADSVSSQTVSDDEPDEPQVNVYDTDMLEYNGKPGYWIAGLDKEGYTYTGKAIRPEPRLYYGTRRLWPGRDYSISYKNNKNASSCDDETLYTTEAAMKKSTAPYMKIRLKGQYSGTIIRNFKIRKKSLSDNDICVITAYGKAGKKPLKLKPAVYLNGIKMPASAFKYDYGTHYDGFEGTGVYDVTISAKEKSNFEETVSGKAVVYDGMGMINISRLKLKAADGKKSREYTGNAIEPAYELYKGKQPAGLFGGTDVLISYENNTEAGTARVHISAVPGSAKCYGHKTVTFKIKKNKTDLSTAAPSVTFIDEKGEPLAGYTAVYTMNGTKPAISISCNGTYLTYGTDYSLSYKGNKKAGAKATLIIKGKGNYKGKYELSYDILPAGLGDALFIAGDVSYSSKKYAYQKTNLIFEDSYGKVLKAGRDYESFKKGASSHGTVFESPDIAPVVGTDIKISLKAKEGGNFSGAVSANYKVINKKKNIKDAEVSLVKKPDNNGGKVSDFYPEELKVRLNNKKLSTDDYEIVRYDSVVKSGGKIIVIIRGKGEYGGVKKTVVDLAPKPEPPAEAEPEPEPEYDHDRLIWNSLLALCGNNAYGAAGLMGNLYAESSLRENNLQNSCEGRLGMNDTAYTAAVDNGSYTNFVHDSAGYGLAQWTYWTRKQGLYNHAKGSGRSIGNLNMQLEFLGGELTNSYRGVLNGLRSAGSVEDASYIVLTQFEKPRNQGPSVQALRAQYSKTFYARYANAQ
ncbi:MAG: hypothetical protein K5686_11985 [Lachnospiraceae bacterium]|nr:hypothetical protein [Lachnospiraceae bacterium]